MIKVRDAKEIPDTNIQLFFNITVLENKPHKVE